MLLQACRVMIYHLHLLPALKVSMLLTPMHYKSSINIIIINIIITFQFLLACRIINFVTLCLDKVTHSSNSASYGASYTSPLIMAFNLPRPPMIVFVWLAVDSLLNSDRMEVADGDGGVLSVWPARWPTQERASCRAVYNIKQFNPPVITSSQVNRSLTRSRWRGCLST
jgi:hypothetical protein